MKQGLKTLSWVFAAVALFAPLQSAVSIPVPTDKPNLLQRKDKTGLPINLANLAAQRPKTSFLGVALGPHDFSEKYGALSYGGGLSGDDSGLYKDAFDLLARGKIAAADQLIKQISDDGLMGHVLYEKYMNPSYKTSYTELKDWLKSYADHPGARDIYKLALARQPAGLKEPLTKPSANKKLARINDPTMQYAKPYVPQIKRTPNQETEVRRFSRNVNTLVRKGSLNEALTLYGEAQERQWMDPAELDRMQAHIAAGYLYAGDYELAFALASQSALRSGKYAPTAGWVAGLALWKKEDYKSASRYFEITGGSQYTSGWMAAAGSFWAARCHEKIGNKKQQRVSLGHAAEHSRTFYGLLATQALGRDFDFNWSVPDFTAEHEALIGETKMGRRALALVAAGQNDKAENELLYLDYRANKGLSLAVLAYANKVGLPSIAMRLGHMLKSPDGKYYDSAIYPLSPWEPEGGYDIDPALVLAMARQESRFDPDAQSHLGAKGLMQVMPETAKYVSQKMGNAAGAQNLHIPSVNLNVGQEYIAELLESSRVNGNLISLLTAYNAGPGNLEKWQKKRGTQDTLFSMETIPWGETREYVERVLANYEIYNLRAQSETPTLAALASGQPPLYTPRLPHDSSYVVAVK